MREPSGLNTAPPSHLGAMSRAASRPVRASSTRTTPSAPAAATREPSGLNTVAPLPAAQVSLALLQTLPRQQDVVLLEGHVGQEDAVVVADAVGLRPRVLGGLPLGRLLPPRRLHQHQ